MTTMVERVARAMERARNPQWTDDQFETWWNRDPLFCECVTSWGYFRGTRKGRCLYEAYFAIEAMREPTEGMMAIVMANHDFRDASIYRPFIDAALNEKETT